jgi:hypothetical protein
MDEPVTDLVVIKFQLLQMPHFPDSGRNDENAIVRKIELNNLRQNQLKKEENII